MVNCQALAEPVFPEKPLRPRGCVLDLLVNRGDLGKKFPACIACIAGHGSAMTGVQPATPGLLGLLRDYLVAQIGAWKSGVRHALAPDCMAQIVQRLTPEDSGAVAAWLAAQPVPADASAVTRISVKLPLACGSVPH